ncbi:MAG: SoxR reducing system RseC family protein [Cognaticolwellia sp.]
MIEEKARVVAIDNDDITVVSNIKSACSGCQQVDNCGSGQVAKAFPQKKLSLTLKSSLPLALGDDVVLGLNESALLQSAWQVYLWPLLGLLLASWLGQWLVNNEIFVHELLAIALGIAGGFCGFILAKRQQVNSATCAKLAPKILRRENQNIAITEISD